MGVEVRRVQRVGSSSLVVTLPKEWARRLGIKAGGQVMLIDEGDSIRVVPLNHEGGEPVRLDLSRLPAGLAGGLPLCIYLSGLQEAEAVVPPEAVGAVRARALDLMGLHIYEAGGAVRMEVLLDPEKVDIPKIIRSLSASITAAVGLVRRLVEGEDVGEEVAVARREFMRSNYVVIRYLAVRSAVNSVESYFTAIAMSYAAFAVDLLHELASGRGPARGPLPEADRGVVNRLLDLIEEGGSLLFRVLATPSVTRLAQLHEVLRRAVEESAGAVARVEAKESAAVVAKLHDVARLLTISSYVAACLVVVAAARRGSGGR